MDSMNIKKRVINVALPLPSDKIILTGFMGCGKSYLSTHLARSLGFSLEDSDSMIENEENRTINEIFSESGESYFRELEAKIAEKMKHLSHCVIATGGGFPIYYSDIKSLGLVIYMDISFDEILRRMTQEDIKKRPLFQDVEKARSLYNSRLAIYKDRSHYQVDATKNIDEMISFIKDKL